MTIDELIAVVKESFDGLERSKLDNVFLTLQGCMEEVMRSDGGNQYKIPHMSKERLRRDEEGEEESMSYKGKRE